MFSAKTITRNYMFFFSSSQSFSAEGNRLPPTTPGAQGSSTPNYTPIWGAASLND